MESILKYILINFYNFKNFINKLIHLETLILSNMHTKKLCLYLSLCICLSLSHTHTHTHTQTHLRIQTHNCAWTYKVTNSLSFKLAHTNTLSLSHINTHTPTHTHTNTHTHTQTHTHIHTQTKLHLHLLTHPQIFIQRAQSPPPTSTSINYIYYSPLTMLILSKSFPLDDFPPSRLCNCSAILLTIVTAWMTGEFIHYWVGEKFTWQQRPFVLCLFSLDFS